MATLILTDIEKIDPLTTSRNIEIIESNVVPEQLDDNTLYIASDEKVSLDEVTGAFDYVIIGVHRVEEADAPKNVKVYFDLENYPFFQKGKSIIQEEEQPKGVFRYRRMVNEAKGTSLLAGDLYILERLLGKAESISVQQTDPSMVPHHLIVMVNFGGGTMAHIEYTVTDRERIEFEWSGVKNILEFDSDDMRPFKPGELTQLPLMFSADALVENARELDEPLKDALTNYRQLLNGGAE